MEAKGWTQANGLDLPPLTWLRYRWLRLSRQPLVGGGMLRARAVADVQQPATMGDDKMQRAPVRHACDVLSRLASLPHSRRRVSPQPDTARHGQTRRPPAPSLPTRRHVHTPALALALTTATTTTLHSLALHHHYHHHRVTPDRVAPASPASRCRRSLADPCSISPHHPGRPFNGPWSHVTGLSGSHFASGPRHASKRSRGPGAHRAPQTPARQVLPGQLVGFALCPPAGSESRPAHFILDSIILWPIAQSAQLASRGSCSARQLALPAACACTCVWLHSSGHASWSLSSPALPSRPLSPSAPLLHCPNSLS
jgi:hypothetical protein